MCTMFSNISLSLAGDGEDYMNVALREGGILFHINLGSGSYVTDIKPHRGSVRFDDNQWHRLVINREAREVRPLTPRPHQMSA